MRVSETRLHLEPRPNEAGLPGRTGRTAPLTAQQASARCSHASDTGAAPAPDMVEVLSHGGGKDESPKASYVTGAVFAADGGRTAI